MARLRFYPISFVYKELDGRPAMFLFGRKDDGRHVCVIDEGLLPYFFVRLIDDEAAEDFVARAKGVRIERDDFLARVVDAEAVTKRIGREDVRLIRVSLNSQKAVYPIVNEFKNMSDVFAIYEHDILYETRYSLARDVTPFALTEADGDFINFRSRVSVFKAVKVFPSTTEYLKDYDVLAFNIFLEQRKTAAGLSESIIKAIAMSSRKTQKLLCLKEFAGNITDNELFNTEAELIMGFKEFIEKEKPDFLVGFNSDTMDLPYLDSRAKHHNIKLDIGLDYREMWLSKTKELSVDISGITHIDIVKTALRVFHKDFMSLDKAYLGLAGQDNAFSEVVFDAGRIGELGLDYSNMILSMTGSILPKIVELSKLASVQPFNASRSGRRLLLESILAKNFFSSGEVMLNLFRNEKEPHTKKLPVNYEKSSRICSNIAELDLSMLYPQLIMKNNLGFDTVNCSCCRGKSPMTFTAEEHRETWFCRKRKSLFATVVENLYQRFQRINSLLEKKPSDTLRARGFAVEILLDTLHQYLGSDVG
ncbi:hypothetical protein JXA85_07080, partial [Candidatus Woesearchaeota archaeon]|nr:hypothetical protein [Candidatus Woesearchaeota archaeon]